MFRFKQFNVDQSDCAMKINTDGVLLGAIAEFEDPLNILDIGTGTGVIALMLAQRFTDAKIDAVEIDEVAAQTALRNFNSSPFAERLMIYPYSFEKYFDQCSGTKYDLIVANPPFYINSLKSPGAKKTIAKHTDPDFFEKLITAISSHLSLNGCCWLIVPVNVADMIMNMASALSVFPHKIINIQSYPHSQPHRVILCFGFNKISPQISNLTIYNSMGVYSEDYRLLLQPYFIAF